MVHITTLSILALLSLASIIDGQQEEEFFEIGQLTAADVDDNLNFAWFLKFLERKNAEENPLPNPILADRIPIQVVDASGGPFACAELEVNGVTYPTGTNGKFSFFPSFDGISFSDGEALSITAKSPGGTCPNDCVSTTITPPAVVGDAAVVATTRAEGETTSTTTQLRDILQMQLTTQDASLPNQLDIALLIDTTGSMCDEIEYLKTELGEILQETSSTVDVRLAYIAFKSEGDAYDVRVSPFGDAPNFADELATEECTGGSNGELVHTALERASQLEWRTGNVARLILLVGDEPPHGDLAQDMADAMTAGVTLRNLGVRVYGLAASGADASAEYLLRLISMITGARYLWLTDDSGIGSPHSEPDVLCYQVTHLDKLLSRVIRSELTGKRVEADPSHLVREVGQQEAGICIYDMNADTDETDEDDNDLDNSIKPPSNKNVLPSSTFTGSDVQSGTAITTLYWTFFVTVAWVTRLSI